MKNYILSKNKMEKLTQQDIEEGRCERKFIVSNLTFEEIERLIRHNPSIFSEIFYERQVNSMYLDFVSLESYRDNIEGSPKRLKIRIRWYGEIFGLIKNPVLELKIKEGEIGRKLTFPLNQFTLNENFSKELLQKEVFDKSDLPDWLNEKLKLTQPFMLNCYKRKYFLSDNKAYRITLDKDLIFFDIKNNQNFFRHKLEDKQNIILEIKYNKKDDNKVEQITQHFPFRLTKSSKYVFGVNLLYF